MFGTNKQFLAAPPVRQLSQLVPLCWEQKNYTYDTWSSATQNVGWGPAQSSNHTAALGDAHFFVTDWPQMAPGFCEQTYNLDCLLGG